MNEVIEQLLKKTMEMKNTFPTGAATEAQYKQYFDEYSQFGEDVAKCISQLHDATTTEIELVKDTLKSLRDTMKKSESNLVQLSYNDVCKAIGKGLAAAWQGDQKTLGELKFCPNLKSESWNNPRDFKWDATKGFIPTKAALGDPVGSMTGNDQYLINPVYEEIIMQEAAKQSVMMNLTRTVPMSGPSKFLNERNRGGVDLKWLTQYGQKIDATRSNLPTRVELKAYTLAGYIPFYDEFDEDSYAELGKIFIEDFTESYGQEYDRQCLTANADPFTGAMHISKAEVCRIASSDASKLTYLDFRAAELKVRPEERRYCQWFFNETILDHIANIRDDNGRPIWRAPGDGMPGRVDGYEVHESSILPMINELKADTPFAVFMNPKRIMHGNRKGIEIKRFEDTTESLEYGELFMRFRKRDGFLMTRPAGNMVIMKTAGENGQQNSSQNGQTNSQDGDDDGDTED